MEADTHGLVDVDNGRVSRRIFIEPDIYQRELERIFARAGFFCAMRAKSRSPAISLRLTWAKTRFWWCATRRARCTPF